MSLLSAVHRFFQRLIQIGKHPRQQFNTFLFFIFRKAEKKLLLHIIKAFVNLLLILQCLLCQCDVLQAVITLRRLKIQIALQAKLLQECGNRRPRYRYPKILPWDGVISLSGSMESSSILTRSVICFVL